MIKIIPFLFALAAITACNNNDTKSDTTVTAVPPVQVDSFLVTDSSWGLVKERTGIDELKMIFGEENIKDVRECDAECMDSIDVTKVYPGQANEVTIIWKDTAYHREIGLIECFGDHPAWHSAEGIKIGSGLKELLKVNGNKISFYGFGWDYGGTVSSYNGGRLENSAILYRLNFNDTLAGHNDIYGDIGLDTDLPLVKTAMAKINVWWITLSFYKPPVE